MLIADQSRTGPLSLTDPNLKSKTYVSLELTDWLTLNHIYITKTNLDLSQLLEPAPGFIAKKHITRT